MSIAPLMEVRDLVKHFREERHGWVKRERRVIRAVDGVSLAIHHRETLGLVGESGCGKSTMARLMARLLQPSRGRIWYMGREITTSRGGELTRLRREIQIIFQDPYSSLDPRQTVGSIIAEPLVIHGLASGKTERRRRVQEMMEAVGLNPEHYNRRPHEFSGGQRQRIGVARALILRPKLIVADEPVSALDVSIQAQILNLLRDLQRDFGLTYVFIAHDLSVVRRMCDRIAVMYLGKMVEVAKREQLYAHPCHPYTGVLLSAVPVPDPRLALMKRRQVLAGDLPSPAKPPAGCRFHTRCPKFVPGTCDAIEPPLEKKQDGNVVACHFPLTDREIAAWAPAAVAASRVASA